jgi:hypothetical protein
MTRFVIGNVGVFPFSGSAEVTGNLQVSGAGNHPGAVLEVMGPATGPGLRVTGNAEITGDLLVKGTTVTVDSATNLKVEGELSSSGPLVVTGQSQIKGNLLLSGSSTFAGVLSASNIVASGSAILKDTLNVSGTTTLATTLNVNGDVQAAKDVHIVGGLTISGTFAPGLISSSSPIQTSDQVRVGETLHVSGATTLAGLLSSSAPIQTSDDLRVGEILYVSGAINGASLAVGSIDVNDGNIANVGDIDADSVSVADAANGLNIDFSGANTGTGLITIADNLAAALTVKEGSNEIVKIVSSNSSEEIVLGYKLDLGDNDIENVGTISADVIQPDAAGTGLDIQFEGNTTTNKISLTDNLADALNVTEAGNSYMKFTTTNNEEQIAVGVGLSSSAPIQTSDVVRVGESLFVSASIALGDTAGTSVPPTSGSHLHIRSSNDAAIRIEADTDNSGGEGHNAYIFLTQDGGGTRGIVGLNGNAAADPGGVFLANAASNAMIVGARTAGSPLQFATNNRVKMTITDDGLVGLGQDFNGTINPVALLHISGGGDDQGVSANAPMMRVDYGDLDNIFHVSRSGSVGINVVPTHALTVAGAISGSDNLQVAGQARVGEDLIVSGNILNPSFSGDANFINDVSISGSLFISSSVASGSSYPLLRIDHHNLTGSVPVLFVTGSGIVGIGTDDPRSDSANTNALHILGGGAGSDNGRDPVINTTLMLENNDHVGIQFMFPNGKAGQLTWGSTTGNRKATFYYDSNFNVYNFEGTSYGGSRAVQFHAGADGVNIGSSNAAHMANNKKKANLHISSSTKGIDTGGAVLLRIDHAEAMISGSLTNNTGTIMLVTGSGRVGILTETPQEALDVGDNSDVSARIGRAHVGYDGTTSDYAIFAHRDNVNTTDYAVQQRANGTTVVNAKSGQSLSLRTGNQNALVVAGASNSNVGINTGSPAARLHVVANTGEKEILRCDGEDIDNVLYVSGTGEVGIGTSSPAAKLAIVGDLSASTNIQAAGQMRVGETLHVSGAINGASITVGSIDVNDGNIANVGDIDADSVSVADAANGLNIDFSGANTGTGLITIADNLAAALTVKEGSNEIIKVVSSNSSEEIVLGYKLDLGDNDIENVGTISADVLQPDAAGTGLDIQFEGNTTKNKMTLTDNLADALNITEAGNSYLKFTTTNSSEAITAGVAVNGTIFSGSTSILSQKDLKAHDANIEAMLKVSGNVRLGLSSSTAVTVNTDTLDSYKAPQFYILSGTTTVKLPGNHPAGTWFVFKAGNAHFGPTEDIITLSATAGDTIDGNTTHVIQSPFASVNCVSDGANWFIW